MDAERLAQIYDLVSTAVKQGRLPGAVVVVGRQGRVVFRKAYGLRLRQRSRRPLPWHQFQALPRLSTNPGGLRFFLPTVAGSFLAAPVLEDKIPYYYEWMRVDNQQPVP